MNVQFWINQKLRFDKGKTELGAFRSLLEILFGLAVLIKLYLGDAPWAYNLLPVIIILAGFTFWFVGYVWDKLGLYEAEARFGMERHLFFQQWLEKNDKAKKK